MMGDSRDQISSDITSSIVYQTVGSVPASARAEAETMMAALADLAPRPVLFSKVKVHNDEGRDPDQRSVVQATMDVSGVILRAQAAGSTAVQALRILGNRMERRVNQLAERRQKAEKRPPATPRGTWRSGDLPTGRPEVYDRPPEERTLVRRKTYSPAERISVSEALFDLDVLDYRFFLFTDESDDKASIVYEDDTAGVAMQKVDGSRPDETTIRPDLRVNETPAPTISVDEAISRLDMSDLPFVYFKDADHQRASVVYRRYDGHYGLIVPTTSDV